MPNDKLKPLNLKALAVHILKPAAHGDRKIVAIAGPPGSGKSTLADQLHQTLTQAGRRACVVPMDGFHLDNAILEANDLLARKGSPPSFDAAGFVHTVQRIKDNATDVYVPVFDRSRDIAIAGAQCVSADDEVILIEGNYLLLRNEPWRELANLFDVQLFINPGLDVIEQRILARWQEAGLDDDTVQRRTYDNDLPNAELVVTGSNTEHALTFDPASDFSQILR